MNQQLLAKQGSELLRFYREQYKAKTGNLPPLNMAKEKWAARELVESFGLDRCQEAVVWYFKVSKRFDWGTFVYGATNYITEMESVKADRAKRAAARQAAFEWRNS